MLIGDSPIMRRLRDLVPRVAASSLSVLIEGETGTGKTMLARAIHDQSPRRGRPFVVIDCGAIPSSLIDSELFGHEKGAFTGALAARPGAFELAEGGTIFLDEIGELPADLQPKLLRAIEDRVVKRVGGVKPILVDVRIVAATNRDLRREMSRGTFRSDLFFRLGAVRLAIPPLRDRPEDVVAIGRSLYRRAVGDEHAMLPGAMVAELASRRWPGNVRELRHTIERWVLVGNDQALPELSDPPEVEPARESPVCDPDLGERYAHAKQRAVASWERRYVEELLRRSGGNVSRAARAAGMNRTHLVRMIRRHDLRAANGDLSAR